MSLPLHRILQSKFVSTLCQYLDDHEVLTECLISVAALLAAAMLVVTLAYVVAYFLSLILA